MQNIKRDILAHARKRGHQNVLSPVEVSVPFLHVNEARGDVETVRKPSSLLLPHELIFCLYTSFYSWWHKVFVVSATVLTEYWGYAQAEPW